MTELLTYLVATWAVVYVLLVATFLLTGALVQRANRRRADKIQKDRSMPPAAMRRELRASLFSLANIALFFAAGHVAHQRLGWGWPAPPLSVSGVVLSLLASLLLFDTWFYWMHRLAHHRWFFRRVHRWHHQSITPTVWSNNNDTFLDNLFMQSYWLVAHLLLPIAPVVLLAHKLYDQVTGTIGHSGYEYGGPLTRPPSPMLSVTHHDQHHRYFTCNYATHFSLWDRWMGTLHRTHDEETLRNLQAAARQQ